MEKILLHHCCAICSVKVIEHLKNKFDVIPIWYNPNIHPKEEYNNRLTATKILLEEYKQKLEIIDESYKPEEWRNIIKSFIVINRCEFCYLLRLRRIANYAKEHNINYFTTTLLASPHQKHDKIKETLQKVANEFELNFYYYDFRPFYYEGKKLAKEKKLYIQKYCGCILSKEEKLKLESKLKILLVDDDVSILKTMSLFFEAQEDRIIETLLAVNGEIALKIFDTEKPDIVFLDIRLPDIDGIEVLKKMKIKNPDIPIIMMTGYKESEKVIEAFRYGVMDCLLKPFNFDYIITNILSRVKGDKRK